MKMKKTHILALALSAIVLMPLASCSDYLDEERHFKDLQTEDRIFQKRNYTLQWLAYCYDCLLDDNQEIGDVNTSITNFSDDVVFNENEGSTYKQWRLGEYQSMSQVMNDCWKECYQGIRQASILINNVYKNQEMDEDEITDARGQARFLRAYFYWLLMRKYGPVPIMPTDGADYNKGYDELSYPRSPYDSCVAFVAREMKTAATELPLTRTTNNITRPTRGAALAVRAKVLLYAASPLFNGNEEMADFTDKAGNKLISQTYDERKWALAAAACRDVMEMGQYSLYTAKPQQSAGFDYPSTITPPHNDKYSDRNFPDGWADVDPFESYRAIFDGDVQMNLNPELIFTRGVNNKIDGVDALRNGGYYSWFCCQLPASCGGYNNHGLTLKQVEAYDMADGKPFNRNAAKDFNYVTASNASHHPYDHCQSGVAFEYCNREPRFYASVSYNGSIWPCTSAPYTSQQNQQVFYYSGSSDGYTSGNGYSNPTGVGIMKYMNPVDYRGINVRWIISSKPEPTIRYADILLMYAEALNELSSSYEIQSWDGSTTYTVSRDVEQMRRGIKPVRMRAGVPDYDDDVYGNQTAMRAKLKHERQVEFLLENQRYFDLRRWKDAPKEEGEQTYGYNIYMSASNRDDFYVPMRVPGVQCAFSRKMYFWPISDSEQKRNKNMTQAPGWKIAD